MNIVIDNRIQKEKKSEYNFWISGYKHSMVLVLCATIINKGIYHIYNVPDILDTHCFVEIIHQLNGIIKYKNHELYINTNDIVYSKISENLLKKIHGTIYLFPSFLAAFSNCYFGKTGGCQIGEGNAFNGKRPYDHIQDVIIKFGGKYVSKDESCGYSFIYKDVKKKMTIDICEYYGTDYNIGPKASGATKTAILLAMKSDDVVIKNPYMQSEIYDLLAFIEKIGYQVDISESMIRIRNCGQLKSNDLIEFTLISDLTEVITYISMALVCNICINIQGLRLQETIEFFQKDIWTLKRMGINVICESNRIRVPNNQIVKRCDITFVPNGILSDHQPFYSLILTLSDGVSCIQDRVWPLRFKFATELNKCGCKIISKNSSVLINPIPPHKSNQVLEATDLRAAAVLLVAAMSISGVTVIKNIDHINRGYERLLHYMSERCDYYFT